MAHRAASADDLISLLSLPDPGIVPDADGMRRCRVRCRVPVTFNAPGSPSVVAAQTGDPAQRAMGGGNADDEIIEGIASSTSVDWYDTRMSKACLDGMAEQFREGVDYLPRHHSFFETVEWDGVIGRTVEAEVKRANVAAPKDGEDAQEQFSLTVRTRLNMREALAQKLVERIRSGQAPGQSIGGWFTEIGVTYDQDGRVQYPLDVHAIELDHLAAVRCPANPDAERVWLALGKALDDAGRALNPTKPAAAPEPISVRGSPVPVPEPGAGASAPAAAPVPAQRALMEIDMDPKQLEEMIARAIGAAVAPLATKLAEIDARTAAPAPAAPVVRDAAPVPAPAPAGDAVALYWQARAQAAETANSAIIAAAGGAGVQRAAAGSPAVPVTTAPGQGAIPELFRSRKGTDLREAAPNACREAQRVGAESIEPISVFRADGFKGLAQFAQAQGESTELAGLVLRTEALQETAFVPQTLRRQDRSALESMLSDVIFAGMRDRLIVPKTTSWA